MRRFALFSAFVVLLLIVIPMLQGCDSSGSSSDVGGSTYQPYTYDEYDSSSEEEPTEEELQDAYSQGWDEMVNEIFDSAPEGELYYGESGYSAYDFEGNAPSYSGGSDLDEAYSQGQSDARDEVFSNSPNGSFYHDDEEYSESDF